MMETQKSYKLTIAIPTYNRGVQIERQLEFLLGLIDHQTRILVIDNCSDEKEFQYLNKFLDQICLVRNKINIGMYANVLKCFELCESEYLWIIGDDNVLRLDSIETVEDSIEKYPSQDTIHLYARESSASIENDLDLFIGSIENFSDFLSLPNTIYKTASVLKFIRTGYRYAYSGAPHLVLTFCVANAGGKHIFCQNTLLEPTKVPNQERWSQIDVALGMPTLCEIPLSWSKKARFSLNSQIYNSYRIEFVTQQLNQLAFNNREEALFLFNTYLGRFSYNRSIFFFMLSLVCNFIVRFPKIGYFIMKTAFYILITLFPKKINFRSRSFDDFEFPDRLKRM